MIKDCLSKCCLPRAFSLCAFLADPTEVQADMPLGCSHCMNLGPEARARLGIATHHLGALQSTCVMEHGRPWWMMPWAKQPAHLGSCILAGKPALQVACLFVTSAVRELSCQSEALHCTPSQRLASHHTAAPAVFQFLGMGQASSVVRPVDRGA